MDAKSLKSDVVVQSSSNDADNDSGIRGSNTVNWDLADSLLMEWYDGHVPESFRTTSHHASSTTQQQKQYMRIYPKYHDIPACYHNNVRSVSANVASSDHSVQNSEGMSTSSFVYCIDDAFPLEITNAIYHYTTQTNLPHKTWGTYITMQQIQYYWDTNEESHCNFHFEQTEPAQSEKDQKQYLDTIATPAAAHFMKNYASTHSNIQTNGSCFNHRNLFRGNGDNDSVPIKSKTNVTCCPELPLPIDIPHHSDHNRCSNDQYTSCSIFDEAHGIAIWALASEIGSEVPYHIDYAELLRYETGIIVPPIIAGTWHCTRNHNSTSFRGGDYCVVVRGNGLDHYYKHGYKGKLATPAANDPTISSSSLVDAPESSDVLQIKYEFNRMICQSGHLPHWSTRVMEPITNTSLVSDAVPANTRVVVGFNVFLHDVGPVIQQGPEHSAAFRRRVNDQKRRNSNLTLQAFTTNPQLRRLLILAKRQKSLNNFKEAQKDLDDRMQQYINSKNERITVAQLLDAFTPLDRTNQWPYDVNDVLVHVHNACKKGTLRVTGADNREQTLTELIRKDMYIECCNNEIGSESKNVK